LHTFLFNGAMASVSIWLVWALVQRVVPFARWSHQALTLTFSSRDLNGYECTTSTFSSRDLNGYECTTLTLSFRDLNVYECTTLTLGFRDQNGYECTTFKRLAKIDGEGEIFYGIRHFHDRQ